jgi:hypothetical protein
MQMDLRMLDLKIDYVVVRVEVSCLQTMIVLHCQEMRMIGDFVVEEARDCFL